MTLFCASCQFAAVRNQLSPIMPLVDGTLHERVFWARYVGLITMVASSRVFDFDLKLRRTKAPPLEAISNDTSGTTRCVMSMVLLTAFRGRRSL